MPRSRHDSLQLMSATAASTMRAAGSISMNEVMNGSPYWPGGEA